MGVLWKQTNCRKWFPGQKQEEVQINPRTNPTKKFKTKCLRLIWCKQNLHENSMSTLYQGAFKGISMSRLLVWNLPTWCPRSESTFRKAKFKSVWFWTGCCDIEAVCWTQWLNQQKPVVLEFLLIFHQSIESCHRHTSRVSGVEVTNLCHWQRPGKDFTDDKALRNPNNYFKLDLIWNLNDLASLAQHTQNVIQNEGSQRYCTVLMVFYFETK